MNLASAVNIEDLRALARRRLPRFVFEYVDGGSEDELTLRANREAFRRIRFRPRALIDVSARETSATILGAPAAFPVIAGPMGLLGLTWHRGDLDLSLAAARAGVPWALSTVSMLPLEDVAREAGGRAWFQCYVFTDRAVSERMIRRAAESGYETLIVTSDFPVSGKRERDWRTGLLPDTKLTFRSKIDIALHPRWLFSVGIRRPRFVNVERELGPERDASSFIPIAMFDPTLDWSYFRRVRDLWRGKLLLKGVLRADDAVRAVESGADGVVLSNHGGRQLDGAISGMDVLPDVARELRGRASIIVDGGVRRGSDIAKAVALGAEAVILGRAVNYGLGAGGAAGVTRALDILKDEFDRALALTGCRRPADLTSDMVTTVE
jgi:(S)-mandelate dehydrogenase